MDKRGQILSLDYVISLILVLLALGLLLNFFELQTVNAKEAQLSSELETLAEGAARLALASPDIACRLTNNDYTKYIGVLPNCIPSEPGRLTKENIWIPLEFGCAIITEPGEIFTATGCGEAIDNDVNNYYSVTRKIVVNNNDQNVTKGQLEECINNGNNNGNCLLTDANLTIAVWRQ
ncbi:MAG: hypothetical protein Q7K34_02085 [archaeon]|nr:hypothetical protein [archaeon]